MLKILCIGPQWRGSNAGALFKALSRLGHIIEVVDENYYLSLNSKGIVGKVGAKLLRKLQINEFNRAIIDAAYTFKPDLVLVYKGAFVLPQTVEYLKRSHKVINFYPDVSFATHGNLLIKSLPLYHHIFTTKTFGIKDMKEQLGILNATFIPHGFDPEIHRPLNEMAASFRHYRCEASFIGTWSPKKEEFLSSLKSAIPSLELKIWGSQWARVSTEVLKSSIQGTTVNGDLYAAAIGMSRINLTLLSEQVKGASSGDRITSRTFHIPAAGGFMLHERTEEVERYFIKDEEMGCFGSKEELIDKVQFYLNNPSQGDEIAAKGKKRAWQDHKLDSRAEYLLAQI